MRQSASPYEVRCPRCDVSFPPETRKCIHCGGATGKSSAPAAVAEWIAQESGDSAATDPTPIEPDDGSIFSMETGGIETAEGEIEGRSSLSRTLLRSFGSLIWIALLIAFTLARDCGGE